MLAVETEREREFSPEERRVEKLRTRLCLLVVWKAPSPRASRIFKGGQMKKKKKGKKLAASGKKWLCGNIAGEPAFLRIGANTARKGRE